MGEELVEVSGFAPQAWDWTNLSLSGSSSSLPVGSSGVYTINLWMREDGLRIDRLLLTTDTNYVPTDFGPSETDRLTGQATTTTTLTRTIVYTYDNLYRLTDAGYTTGESYAYAYDEVGNRLQQIIDGDTTTYLYDAANRLEQLNGQSVYTFDANGNLLNSDTLTNTFDAANRLTSSTRNGATVEPIYNGVNDRVGQTVGISTTDFALDVVGLPEVIYTSEGNVYLHLPGVIVAESAAGEVRYLLSDGLGSVRQAVDESGAVVAYNEFDPYGNPVQNGSELYGFTGEWWNSYIKLLHLRTRWYMVETGTFLSRDPWEGDELRPLTLNGWSYVEGNPVNRIDPLGLYTWYDILKFNKLRNRKHERIERWMENEWIQGNFWNVQQEFNQIGFRQSRPDILYFPQLAPNGTTPIDFSNCSNNSYVGEVYEIEPMYVDRALGGLVQVVGYMELMELGSQFGYLSNSLTLPDVKGKMPPEGGARYTGGKWDFNSIDWKLGTSLGLGQIHTIPMATVGDIWIVSPVPGLILYVDDDVRRNYAAVGITLTAANLARYARNVTSGVQGLKGIGGGLKQPQPAITPIIIPGLEYIQCKMVNRHAPELCTGDIS